MKYTKQNLKLKDLHKLNIKFFIGEIVSRNISLTETEFDNIAAEWLRFAKQRKQRTDKTVANEESHGIN